MSESRTAEERAQGKMPSMIASRIVNGTCGNTQGGHNLDTWMSRECEQCVTEAIDAAIQAARTDAIREAAKEIRAACPACDGSGAQLVAGTDEHDGVLVLVEDSVECEYCGRPIAALFARWPEAASEALPPSPDKGEA